jgi:Ca2+/Na+ antiporter
VTLGVVAGVLLIASGVVLASRSPKAQALPLVAAIACLAVFLLIPRMSIFSKMLGIGFPIALLLFLRLGRGQPTRTVA